MSEPAVSARVVRALHGALEPYHEVLYLAKESHQTLAGLGFTSPWGAYFAGRAAPLGVASPALVTAVFYHFNPQLVEREIPAVWAATDPAKALSARLAGVSAALRARLGDLVDGAPFAEAATLAAEAAAACDASGRPLGAANAALPVPQDPVLDLWQATTTLREYRGDGHVCALLSAGLDAVEALVTITAAGGEFRKSIQQRREWSDADWEAAEKRLQERGLLDDEGCLTFAGTRLRQTVEDDTDRLAAPPWQALGKSRALRLYEIVRPLSLRLLVSARRPVPPPDLPETLE